MGHGCAHEPGRLSARPAHALSRYALKQRPCASDAPKARMRTSQGIWSLDRWNWSSPPTPATAPSVVLVFGAGCALLRSGALEALRASHPGAPVLACSTAGEIHDVHVLDDSVVASAIWLEHTPIRGVQVPIPSADASWAAGVAIARALAADDLAHVLVFSEGLHVNGSDLVRGIGGTLASHVGVTGALAGDGARFGRTLVGWNRLPAERCVAAIGLYGKHVRVRCGSMGGWDAFGPDRMVTRSEKNVLYELDGEPALTLYKKYLGEHAAGLPSSALRFPLLVTTETAGRGVVRTILNVREQDGAMIFAGDIPQGSSARLMKANVDRLVDGASDAALATTSALDVPPSLAILVSCVGRKLVLRQRVEDEVEAVRDALGPSVPIVGLYSYGEISPLIGQTRSELHNQTMTITTIGEMDP